MKYAIERQLTIAIENQPGHPAAIARRVMATHGINIRDISVIDTVEQGWSVFVISAWTHPITCPPPRTHYACETALNILSFDPSGARMPMIFRLDNLSVIHRAHWSSPRFRGRFTAWDSSRASRWLRVRCWTYPPPIVDG